MAARRPQAQPEHQARPQPSGERAFWLVAYAFFAVMLGTTLPTPLYPLYQRRFGFSELLITVIFAVYAVSVIAALFLFGRLSDQIGRRFVLLPGIVCSALSAVAFLLAGGAALILAGRVLSGISAAIFTGTATAALLDLIPGDQRLRATAIGVAANLGGLGTGNLLSGLLAQWAPAPRMLPFAIDLILLVPAFIGVLLAPETVQRRAWRWRLQRLHLPAEVRPVFIPAAVAGFCGFAVFGIYGAVVPGFLPRVLHVTSHVLVGAIVFFLLIASAAGQVAVSRLSERIALPVGSVGVIAGAILVGIAAAIPALWPLLSAVPVLGFGQGLVIGSGLGGINKRAPQEQRGEIASTYFIALYVGVTWPVVSVGLLAQAFGLRLAAVTLSTVAALVVIGVLATILRRPVPE
jgi:MFS family permease